MSYNLPDLTINNLNETLESGYKQIKILNGLQDASINLTRFIEKDKINQVFLFYTSVALDNNELIVPVVNNSEEKNFLGILRSVSDLAKRARSGNLDPSEVSGSTFTILGRYLVWES